MKIKSMSVSRIRKDLRFAVELLRCMEFLAFDLAGAQSLQTVNMRSRRAVFKW